MSIYTKLNKSLSVFAVGLLAVSSLGTFTQINVRALSEDGISVLPDVSNADPNEKLSKAWFIKKMNPGDKVEQTLNISNFSDKEKTIEISAEDRNAGNEGSFVYTSVQDKKTRVGSWITLSEKKIVVPPKKAKLVKFTINVPKDVKPGEYAGVVAANEIKPEVKNKTGFQLVSRIGARVYITVPGELDKGFKFDEFKFITPDEKYTDPKLFKDLMAATGNQPAEDMYMTWKFKNTGKIFSKLKGNIEIETPNGKVTDSFDRDFAPFDESVAIKFLNISSKWAPGKYKARFTFEASPIIAGNKGEVKDNSPVNFVETTFELSQAQLDKIKADKADSQVKPGSSKAEDDKGGAIGGATSSNASTQSQDQSQKKDDNSMLMYIGGGIIALLLVVIGLLVFKKSSDKKEKTEKTTNEEKK